MTLVPQPAQPSAIDLGPLGLPPRHPRTLDTHDLISERPSGSQAPQPEASTSMAPAAVGRRPPGRGRLSDQVIHEHAATALASMALCAGKQRQRIKVCGNQSVKYRRHSGRYQRPHSHLLQAMWAVQAASGLCGHAPMHALLLLCYRRMSCCVRGPCSQLSLA